ncbi:MAG: methylated-DNA--[protein]-cysteine S-methyltransferase [Cytophagaceae bacterium]|nr:methylated-DNA--[protein]-cysteine S-methyltransferase [Cytophagaceae bacterium]
MSKQEEINYSRIAEAIEYIRLHFKEQPSLEHIAEQLHLSPFHFQRLFTDWAGVSPKQFLQFISVNYAKQLLKEKQATLFDVAEKTGLSGTGRLHDLFVKIEGMTPGEYKNGGEQLSISYSFEESPFGKLIVASTMKGICYIAFLQDKEKSVQELQAYFPKAAFQFIEQPLHKKALRIFEQDWKGIAQIKLHLKGTDFQLKVWEALLKIPSGSLTTYASIAEQIESPTASRAVGTAIGSNPIAFLIPCHRVIQSSGIIGGYMWGPTRKTAIIGWEAARVNS